MATSPLHNFSPSLLLALLLLVVSVVLLLLLVRVVLMLLLICKPSSSHCLPACRRALRLNACALWQVRRPLQHLLRLCCGTSRRRMSYLSLLRLPHGRSRRLRCAR